MPNLPPTEQSGVRAGSLGIVVGGTDTDRLTQLYHVRPS